MSDGQSSPAPTARRRNLIPSLTTLGVLAGIAGTVIAALALCAQLGSDPPPGLPPRPLNLIAQEVGAYSVVLSWTAPEAPNLGTLTYRITQRRDGDTETDLVTYDTGSQTRYTVTGLMAGQRYRFTVVAIDSRQYLSSPTDWRAVDTLPGDNLPPPPDAPTALSASEVTSSSVRLSWQPGSAAPGLTLTGYRVLSIEGSTTRDIGQSSTPSFAVTGLSPATAYLFVVKSEDSLHNVSLPTEPLQVVTLTTEGLPTSAPSNTPPTTPLNLRVTAQSSDSLTLAWNPSTDGNGITGYRVYRSGAFVTQVSATSYKDNGLSPSTTYNYTVVAVDTLFATSAPSAGLLVSTAGDTASPSTPGNLRSTETTATSVSLQWNSSTDTGGSGLAGYVVYRNGATVATTAGLAFTDTGLSASTTYTYTVRARDGAGNTSSASNSLAATTGTAPGRTLVVTPSSGNANATFKITGQNWSTNPDVQVNLWISGPGIPGERCTVYPMYTDKSSGGTLVGDGPSAPDRFLDNAADGALALATGAQGCEPSFGTEFALQPGVYTIQARYHAQSTGPTVQLTITG